MLLLALLVAGLFAGYLAQIILGKGMFEINWPLALGAGIGGSFVFGLISSLLSSDGLQLRPSGLIGGVIGAIIVTAGYQFWQKQQAS